MSDYEEWLDVAEIQMEELKTPSEFQSEWKDLISDPSLDYGEVI